jgi:hypothetical protein
MASEMTFTLTFGGDPQDLTITLSGYADRVGLHRLNAELSADPRFLPGLAVLVDASALDTSHLTDEALADAAGLIVERDWETQPLAIAILAPDADTFATAARYRAHLGGSRSRREVFSNDVEAAAWLREQKG